MADEEPREDIPDADDLEERSEHIARVVKDYLREGEAFLLRCRDEEILVEEAPYSEFQKKYPRLYGRLLSVNEQLNGGCALPLTLLAVGGLLCLGVHAGWLDGILPPNVVSHLQTWWFYGPFLGACTAVGFWFNDRFAAKAYRQGRAELLAVMRDEGFDRDALIPEIKDIAELENIFGQLKLDRGPFHHE